MYRPDIDNIKRRCNDSGAAGQSRFLRPRQQMIEQRPISLAAFRIRRMAIQG